MKRTLLLVACFALTPLVVPQNQESCDSVIYCQGSLLDTVQMARIFKDSKSFVDMSLTHSVEETLQNFNELIEQTNNNPTHDDIKNFVDQNFVSEGELIEWQPSDFKTNPAFLKEIPDIVLRDFARNLVSIWPSLARKMNDDVKEHPDRHSLIPVPNGFIIPGGRFKELYYWDSYWIIKGLLVSEMTETVKGMLGNLLSLVKRFGFVPNGSRVYYLNRSQPPLLSLMIDLYLQATEDVEFLKDNIGTIDSELQFWLDKRIVSVQKDGKTYQLAHYGVESGTPRPESYYEDVMTCSNYQAGGKETCYKELKNGAESGLDFSTRWFYDENGGHDTNLTHIQTSRSIPVDLNAYLCKAFALLGKFYATLGENKLAIKWYQLSKIWQEAIQQVLYNDEDGIWYDLDVETSKHRRYFYPSNFAPLWADAYNTDDRKTFGKKAADYFQKQGLMQYRGGIPSSLVLSGEQWDFPNAWPPLQDLVILGLDRSGQEDASTIAQEFAARWLKANVRGYHESKEMFEKYDAVNPGKFGGGGEYVVQPGFGWTNGVALSFIDIFYRGNNKKLSI